ncbi:sensor histidine kinase [Kitasatospora sp. NPDC051853]|uniref:sensor histidine kinase n=1 Tax=Kitasatospora sp. NPDC051853 TaxID=3364058 RepID=UPI00379A1425
MSRVGGLARAHRKAAAALAVGAVAALFVLLAVLLQSFKDVTGVPPDPERMEYLNRIGPLVGPAGLPGPLVPAVVVAAVAWEAARWAEPPRRPQAALLAGAASGLLAWSDFRWLTAYSAYPFVEENVVEWGLKVAVPQFGLVVALVTRFALEPLGRDAPLRARSALLAGAAALVPMLFVSPVLKELNVYGPQYDPFGINWLAESGPPSAALVVATTAWLTAGRALRPVEAIRRGLAELSTRSLDRRVPVPRTGDELTDLARTTNDILDRLEHSAERQRRFVADASHELRSPIANLRASLEGSLAHPEGVDWEGTVRGAVGDIQRLQRLTDDLLLLTRLDGGGARPDGALVDLAGLALDLVEEYRHLPRTAALRLTAETAAAGGRARVPGSAVQLERLLRNLLDNACRHADGAVTVRVAVEEDGAVRLEVRDDGPGIPEADRERVFERFTRLDDARTRSVGGSGLGLAIAREIATGHGGSLRVARSAGGAVLTARFPVPD